MVYCTLVFTGPDDVLRLLVNGQNTLDYHRLYPVIPATLRATPSKGEMSGWWKWAGNYWGRQRPKVLAEREDLPGMSFQLETEYAPPLGFTEEVSARYPELRVGLSFENSEGVSGHLIYRAGLIESARFGRAQNSPHVKLSEPGEEAAR